MTWYSSVRMHAPTARRVPKHMSSLSDFPTSKCVSHLDSCEWVSKSGGSIFSSSSLFEFCLFFLDKCLLIKHKALITVRLPAVSQVMTWLPLSPLQQHGKSIMSRSKGVHCAVMVVWKAKVFTTMAYRLVHYVWSRCIPPPFSISLCLMLLHSIFLLPLSLFSLSSFFPFLSPPSLPLW